MHGPVATVTALTCLILLSGCSTAPRLPAGYPSAVPVVAGDVLAASHDQWEWHIWIAASRPLQAYQQARRELLSEGFDETANSESAGGSDGQFCDPTWCAGITGYRDPEHGDSVMYVVFRTSGLGPPKPLVAP